MSKTCIHAQRTAGDVMLEIKELGGVTKTHGITQLRRGEVLGISGLVGGTDGVAACGVRRNKVMRGEIRVGQFRAWRRRTSAGRNASASSAKIARRRASRSASIADNLTLSRLAGWGRLVWSCRRASASVQTVDREDSHQCRAGATHQWFVRRQPAEGGHRAIAARGRGCVAARRADARH